MKIARHLVFAFILVLLYAPQTLGFHVPPWDTGHNSFQPDDGDNDNDPGNDSPCQSGSPVELASGNFVYSARDLVLPGLGPVIDIVRTYNSRDMRSGPFGIGWVFPYDQKLVETTDEIQVFAICSQPDGKRERFIRRPDGGYDPPPHVHSTLTKNADNTFTLRDKYGQVRRFNTDGRLAAIVDRNGNILSLNYDSTGFPVSIADATGRVVQFTKNANGKIGSLTDPAGRIFTYSYDNAGNLIRLTDPLGNSTVYQYDAKSNLTAIVDPRGNRLLGATYDSEGRVMTLLEGAETWTYNYLTNPKRTTRRDSANRTWTFYYNDGGNITRVTDPLNLNEQYTYDANVNLVEYIDKNANKTNFSYDAKGNPLTVTDALGNTRALTYEQSFNHPLTIRDRLGNTSTYEYDGRGNLIRTTNALGQIIQFEYDSKGQLTRLTDPAGNATLFSYDSHGNLIGTTDPLNNSSAASFNILGQVISSSDAVGRTSSYAYDDNQRLIRTVNPEGGITVNEYDASGNIVAVIAPNGTRTSFEYDTLNRLVRVTNPLNQVTSYSYNRKNNVVTKTDHKGQQTQYSYDALDRLTQKSRSDGSTTYTYDNVGNLLTINDPDSSLAFVHDTLNRITEARTGQTPSQPATTIRFTYDAEGYRRSMVDPAGGVTSYNYDALLRLTSLTDPSGQAFSFSYDSNSRRTQTARSAGLTTTYGYDAANRLLSIGHQSSAGSFALNYTYDTAGNRLSMGGSLGAHAYSYDALSRLIGVTNPGPNSNENYSYDPVGNRVSSHLSASSTFDAANRLTADSTFDYNYDANGNLIRKTERLTGNATIYTYDAENQLIRIDFPGGGSAAYRYDGLGRRIEKNVNGQITQYIYDGQDILFENYGTATEARYTHGPRVDEILSVRRGGQVSLFETDTLGSVVRVVDGADVKATYTYDSFGRIISQTGVTQSPYLFQGREYDQESGLYYFRARYYDPGLGRFLNEDPITFAGGANFYRFALNNPVRYLDPFGLRPCQDDWLDGLQTLLDLAGLIPGFGEFFDLANAGIYGLRGDSLNAALSLGSAVPILGWGSTAAKLGNKAVKAGVTEGIYEFTSTSGRKYVGQSGDIDRRLAEHIRNGKVTPEEAARATRTDVQGGKTAREIAEQRRIDELGGIQNLENKVNPIGPNRRHLLDP